MEKLRFTIRFIFLLATLPVIMFTELTRKEVKTAGETKTIEKVSPAKNDEAMIEHFPSMQAVFN